MIITGAPRLAFDRASVRSIDADGRLHIAVTNISKANVCPYYGSEIPDSENMGLDPERIYYLYRSDEELEKGASTFNNLPILDRHVPVSADDHMPEIVIGSTGTDAAFVAPYLQNSAVIWARSAIDDIEAADREQKDDMGNPLGRRQWSCAYRYVADMTPGNFRGSAYDGIMRNIIGNHVALVAEGRAGPDVMVGDQSMLKSRAALLLSGAMLGFLRPKLAADKKLDLSPLLKGVNAASLTKRKTALAEQVVSLATPLLAADEGLEVGDVVEIIEAVQGNSEVGERDDINDPAPAVDDDDAVSKILAFLKGKLSEEDMAAVAQLANQEPAAQDDTTPPDDPEKKDDKAMDAATVKRLIAAAEKNVANRLAAIRQAERDVAPFVGEITVAMDSAEAIYKLALDEAKVDLTDVPPSAYGAMVRMLPKPGDAPVPQPRIAADAGNTADFRKRFPTAGTLVRS